MKTIETDRLLLRHMIEDDANDIFEYAKNEDVGPNAGWKPHESIEETREIMKTIFLDQPSVFGIVLKATGKMIGSIGLIPDPKRENDRALMLGYAIGKDYWRNGYMTEAAKAIVSYGFRELDLDLISVYCYSSNDRSRRVIEKCGFEYEGRLRLAEKRYDGIVFDSECFSLRNNIRDNR